jgi:hypothetical protein
MEGGPVIKTDKGQDRPPVFRSWRGLHAAVLLNLALQVFLFYLFTRAFK